MPTFTKDTTLNNIAEKVYQNQRLSFDEGVYLFKHAELGFVGSLANYIREQKHGNYTYFNKNFHIEPTNICVFDCKFCSYSRAIRERSTYDAWEMSEQDIYDKIKSYEGKNVTEVHIVGGVHPKMGLHYFATLIKNIKTIRPDIHIKAFTAVELEYMCRKAGVSYEEGLQLLKKAGQNSLPGGGAEIFNEEIRSQICKDKCSSEEWLQIHETAHRLNMPSNATILYGHIESYEHRVEHMERLRNLQDQTKGFNAFIPLKFRNTGNDMAHVPECSVIEDLRNYAISRIFLDNFSHIKAYWPMIGRNIAQLSLAFGVDDIDGTVDDSTKIYTMAGAEEQTPVMTTEQIIELIKQVGRNPVERDSVYNIIKDYGMETCPA
ncbi:MAG: aminofutalosine synthase MqnE [Flavobacteriales bacterium]|nr:aminofutalosine synthase MqnE [Flavobacteriales bacterium]